MKHIKRTAALLVATALLVLSSCSGMSHTIVIGEAQVEDAVFIYYLNAAVDELGTADRSSAILRATELTRYYVKINTIAAQNGIFLTAAQKAELSDKVCDYWSIFGAYLTSVGVTKQALTKVYTGDALEARFLDFFYGKNGTEKPTDKELINCFNQNIIVFRSVNGYFERTNYGGEVVRLTDSERELLISRYSGAATELNNKSLTLAEAQKRLTESSSGEPEQVVLNKESTDYPEGFFTEIAATEAGKAVVVATQDNVFLVVRENVTADSEIFAEKYDYVLEKLRGEELRTRLASAKNVNARLNESRAAEYYNTIIQARKAV